MKRFRQLRIEAPVAYSETPPAYKTSFLRSWSHDGSVVSLTAEWLRMEFLQKHVARSIQLECMAFNSGKRRGVELRTCKRT